jgi:excisionase family DNA binding protein
MEVRKMKQVLTVDEVALSLNVERKTVYGILKRGELEGVRAGRLWRVSIAAFQNYLKPKLSDSNGNPSSCRRKPASIGWLELSGFLLSQKGQMRIPEIRIAQLR